MTPAPAIFSPNFSHRINNFQIIRAFAASGVVVYHCDIYFADMHTEFYGVALFFVLSGYLMSALSNKAALRFALDRCWRIIPSYWLATLIAYQLFYGYSAWSGYTFSHLVQSLLFIPHAGSGGMFPLLGVGWTLNFEMYFYAIFTLSIAISHKFAPALAAAFVLLLDCILPLITDNQAVLFYYTHNYINYFVYGIIVFYATNLHTFWSALPPPIQADLHTLWKKLSKFPRVNCVCVCVKTASTGL